MINMVTGWLYRQQQKSLLCCHHNTLCWAPLEECEVIKNYYFQQRGASISWPGLIHSVNEGADGKAQYRVFRSI